MGGKGDVGGPKDIDCRAAGPGGQLCGETGKAKGGETERAGLTAGTRRDLISLAMVMLRGG